MHLILNIFTQYKSTSEWGERDRERGDRERERDRGEREWDRGDRERENADASMYQKIEPVNFID